ncbi:MAG: toll/interleukin-1 receptor domain-containing protein [Pseudonocardiaceae bacterium]
MATIGDHDRAKAFTTQIGPLTRGSAVRGVAAMLAAASDDDAAEVLTRYITESGWGMGALGELVKAAVTSDYDRGAQLIGEAEALARRIADPRSRRRALTYISEAAAAVSDHDRAVRLADEVEALPTIPLRPGEQSSLGRVVEVMAAGGDHDRAEALARRIIDPDRRAGTLARLARILVETDKETSHVPEHARSSSPLMVRARRLLAAALEAGSWIEVVASLARIDPVAVSVLADEVERRWGLDSSSGSRDGGGSVVVKASNDQVWHLFISYVREDVGSVDRLVRVLRDRGVEVWLDRDEIKPGAHWAEAIREAIRNGSFFFACFSTSYALRERSYMHEELALAVEELRKRRFGQAWFIPILLDDGEIPDIPIGSGETLRSLQWVSLYDDWDAGICKILAAISSGGNDSSRRNEYQSIELLVIQMMAKSARILSLQARYLFGRSTVRHGG